MKGIYIDFKKKTVFKNYMTIMQYSKNKDICLYTSFDFLNLSAKKKLLENGFTISSDIKITG